MILTEEEIKILNEFLANGFKYLTREENGFLYVYSQKPRKVNHPMEDELLCRWSCSYGLIDDVDKELFPNVHWEDEKPTSIEELMKEVK